MADLFVSFYLRDNRVHIGKGVLCALGNPGRICFLLDKTGTSMLIIPYEKRDFRSHKVPAAGCMEISSQKLCRIISSLHNYDTSFSYRISGRKVQNRNAVVFDLKSAVIIPREPQGGEFHA